MSDARPPARISFTFTIEERPKLEIVARGDGGWSRLGDWIWAAPERRRLLVAMLRLLREARESTS